MKLAIKRGNKGTPKQPKLAERDGLLFLIGMITSLLVNDLVRLKVRDVKDDLIFEIHKGKTNEINTRITELETIKGELVELVESPNETYQDDTYVAYGNIADKNQVRVVIIDVKSKDDFNDTTAYWLYSAGEELQKVDLVSEETLVIADKN